MPDDATAEAAEVSRKTVFTAVGGEVELLKLAFDWSVVGDDEPAPSATGGRCGKSGRKRPGPVPTGMGRLREGLTAEDAADLAWLHIDPTLYARLVLDRGWSSDRFADWLARTMSWQLLGVRGAGPAEGRIGRSTIQLTSLKDIRSVSHSAIGGSCPAPADDEPAGRKVRAQFRALTWQRGYPRCQAGCRTRHLIGRRRHASSTQQAVEPTSRQLVTHSRPTCTTSASISCSSSSSRPSARG